MTLYELPLCGGDGQYLVVSTSSGRYLFDLSKRTVAREPRPSTDPALNGTLPIAEILSCRVGLPGLWTLRAEGADLKKGRGPSARESHPEPTCSPLYFLKSSHFDAHSTK
jgi:hypothetical protein